MSGACSGSGSGSSGGRRGCKRGGGDIQLRGPEKRKSDADSYDGEDDVDSAGLEGAGAAPDAVNHFLVDKSLNLENLFQPAKFTKLTSGEFPKRGDHIARMIRDGTIARVAETLGCDLPYHHGIYVGGQNKSMVIHYSGDTDEKTEAKVKDCSLTDFLNGEKEYLVVGYDEKACLKNEDTAKFAELLLEIEWGKGQYNVVLHNCENFAALCKTGCCQISDQSAALMQALTKAFAELPQEVQIKIVLSGVAVAFCSSVLKK
eukprot:TRINITY_DN34509_c0_g1_i1.p1 TRINITY_DN34509_c0_g1~~TRINITY_DN34509_c0_g1_i1.p1  ORF type:complete len:273 (+),score=37.27 TRINITY_DN34509_c0_g1_i1:41-820(+)